MLSDHAVLQREMPVHIWGWADAGKRLRCRFMVRRRWRLRFVWGKWSVYLRPEQAGGPYSLTVPGE